MRKTELTGLALLLLLAGMIGILLMGADLKEALTLLLIFLALDLAPLWRKKK